MGYFRRQETKQQTIGKSLFVLRPTTGPVRHKAFLKVGPDAGPQPTGVRQNPKIPLAPSAPPKWAPQTPENKQQTIGELHLTFSLTCIYGEGRLHYVGSTTIIMLYLVFSKSAAKVKASFLNSYSFSQMTSPITKYENVLMGVRISIPSLCIKR